MADKKIKVSVVTDFSQSQQQLSAFIKQINDAGNSLNKVTLNAIALDTSKAVQQINQKLQEISRNPALKPLEVNVKVSANRDAQGQLTGTSNAMLELRSSSEKAGKEIASFGERLGFTANRIGSYLISIKAVIAAEAGLTSSIQSIAEINTGINKLTQTFGGSTERANALAQSVNQISRQYGLAAQDLLKVANTLQRTNLFGSDKDLLAGVNSYALAKLTTGFENFGDKVEDVTAIMNQFGKTGKDFASILETIAEVSAKTGTDPNGLLSAARFSGQDFAKSGNLQQYLALLGGASNLEQGSPTSIGNSLSLINNAVFKTQNLDRFNAVTNGGARNADGTPKALLDILRVTAAKTKDYTQEQLQDLVSKGGGGAGQEKFFVDIIRDLQTGDKSIIENAIKAVDGKQNLIFKNASIALDSFDNRVKRIGQSFNDTFTEIGNNNGIKELIKDLESIANTANTVFKALAPLLPTLIKFGTIKLAATAITSAPDFVRGFTRRQGVNRTNIGGGGASIVSDDGSFSFGASNSGGSTRSTYAKFIEDQKAQLAISNESLGGLVSRQDYLRQAQSGNEGIISGVASLNIPRLRTLSGRRYVEAQRYAKTGQSTDDVKRQLILNDPITKQLLADELLRTNSIKQPFRDRAISEINPIFEALGQQNYNPKGLKNYPTPNPLRYLTPQQDADRVNQLRQRSANLASEDRISNGQVPINFLYKNNQSNYAFVSAEAEKEAVKRVTIRNSLLQEATELQKKINQGLVDEKTAQARLVQIEKERVLNEEELSRAINQSGDAQRNISSGRVGYIGSKIGNFLSNVDYKGILKNAAPIGLALGGDFIANQISSDKGDIFDQQGIIKSNALSIVQNNKGITSSSSAFGGLSTGALIGSQIDPVLGTAVGAIVGLLNGLFSGIREASKEASSSLLLLAGTTKDEAQKIAALQAFEKQVSGNGSTFGPIGSSIYSRLSPKNQSASSLASLGLDSIGLTNPIIAPLIGGLASFAGIHTSSLDASLKVQKSLGIYTDVNEDTENAFATPGGQAVLQRDRSNAVDAYKSALAGGAGLSKGQVFYKAISQEQSQIESSTGVGTTASSIRIDQARDAITGYIKDLEEQAKVVKQLDAAISQSLPSFDLFIRKFKDLTEILNVKNENGRLANALTTSSISSIIGGNSFSLPQGIGESLTNSLLTASKSISVLGANNPFNTRKSQLDLVNQFGVGINPGEKQQIADLLTLRNATKEAEEQIDTGKAGLLPVNDETGNVSQGIAIKVRELLGGDKLAKSLGSPEAADAQIKSITEKISQALIRNPNTTYQQAFSEVFKEFGDGKIILDRVNAAFAKLAVEIDSANIALEGYKLVTTKQIEISTKSQSIFSGRAGRAVEEGASDQTILGLLRNNASGFGSSASDLYNASQTASGAELAAARKATELKSKFGGQFNDIIDQTASGANLLPNAAVLTGGGDSLITGLKDLADLVRQSGKAQADYTKALANSNLAVDAQRRLFEELNRLAKISISADERIGASDRGSILRARSSGQRLISQARSAGIDLGALNSPEAALGLSPEMLQKIATFYRRPSVQRESQESALFDDRRVDGGAKLGDAKRTLSFITGAETAFNGSSDKDVYSLMKQRLDAGKGIDSIEQQQLDALKLQAKDIKGIYDILSKSALNVNTIPQKPNGNTNDPANAGKDAKPVTVNYNGKIEITGAENIATATFATQAVSKLAAIMSTKLKAEGDPESNKLANIMDQVAKQLDPKNPPSRIYPEKSPKYHN